MNSTDLPTNLSNVTNKGSCDHLIGTTIPNISLPNQDGNLLKLNRSDTFRLVFFFLSNDWSS